MVSSCRVRLISRTIGEQGTVEKVERRNERSPTRFAELNENDRESLENARNRGVGEWLALEAWFSVYERNYSCFVTLFPLDDHPFSVGHVYPVIEDVDSIELVTQGGELHLDMAPRENTDDAVSRHGS